MMQEFEEQMAAKKAGHGGPRFDKDKKDLPGFGLAERTVNTGKDVQPCPLQPCTRRCSLLNAFLHRLFAGISDSDAKSQRGA